MTRPRKCFCRCHGPIAQLFGIRVDNLIEAEAACGKCKNEHPSRLSYAPPERWTPYRDATGDEGRE